MTTATEPMAAMAVRNYGAGQDEWELSQLVEILSARKSHRLALEIGCDQGGTLWLWRQLYADVVAITLHTREDGVFADHGARVIVGNSRDPWARHHVLDVLDGRQPDMVFVDGGHDLATAHSDIGWACDVAPGGVIVVHDIRRRTSQPQTETWAAWEQWRNWYARLEIHGPGEDSPGTGLLFPGAPSV